MTTLERFRVVAVVAAALALLALLLPDRTSNSARRVTLLGSIAGTWFMLAASLIPRTDLDRATARPVVIAVAIVALVIATWIATLVVVRFPVVWLVVLALALPIRIPVTLGSQSANLLGPLYAVITVGVLALIVRARRDRLPPLRLSYWIAAPLVLFVAFTLVSLVWTSDLTEGTSKVVFFYIPFAILTVLVVAWWDLVADPLRPVAATTVAIAVATALLALFQFTTKTIWWNATLEQGNKYNSFFRTNGIFFDPNILGRFLVMAIFVSLAALAVTDDRVQMWIVTAAIVILGAGLIVTFSRSSALMLLVGLPILAVRFFGVKRTLITGVAALVLIGAPTLAASGRIRDQVSSISEVAKASEGRARLVKGGVELWKTAPVVGIGVGSFAQRYADTLPERTRRKTRVVISHTAPVTVLAELGVVGIGLLALLAGGVLVGIGRRIRHDRANALTLAAILAALVGIFAHSTLYSAFFEDPYVWALMAIGAALVIRPIDVATPPVEATPAPR